MGLGSLFGSIGKGIKKVGKGAVGTVNKAVKGVAGQVNKVMPPGIKQKKKPQPGKIFPTSGGSGMSSVKNREV